MFPRLTLKQGTVDKDIESGIGAQSGCSSDTHDNVGLRSPTSTIVASPTTCSEKTASSQQENRSKTKEELARDKAIAEEEIRQTVTMKLNSYAVGYPSLAAFQSSDSSFSIYRSFDYLHSRVILELQEEIRGLEAELTEVDEMDGFSPNLRRRELVRSRELDLEAGERDDGLRTREVLLALIRDKLVRYDEILLKARELNACQRPSNRDYRSLRHWCRTEKPLMTEEQDFIKRREDLITLRQGREWAGFDGWIESSIKRLPERMSTYLFTTPELREKTEDAAIEYYSPARVEKLVGLIITLIIFILLVLPVVAMYELTSVGNRDSTIDAVGLLVVFTLLFSAAMSMLTKAKRHELFAASAAYCAVLVVFISNFNNDGPGGRNA